MTHPIMSRISARRVREEIVGSTKAIQENLGAAPRTFAYPNGTADDFNETVKTVLQDVGYRCAVTTVFGTNTSGRDLFELRRGGPWETHLPTFAVKMDWYRFCPC